MTQRLLSRRLLGGTALVLVNVLGAGALVTPVAAQPQAADGAAQSQSLQEVVVTATRRSDTIHNVPLTITAVTPQQIERQGLKTAYELTQSVPALFISAPNSTTYQLGGPNVAIRGIRSTTGAATTGIYIDDVPLQTRTGTVFPNLFDLERVEVLKGPQGTLYGGSSEGGTLRFITPAPSFTKYSAYARGEVAGVNHGGANYEGGIAVGGPLVQDKLAMRVAAWYRKDAGYVDHVSQYTGAVLAGGKDTNSAEHISVHAQLAWKPTDRATVTLGYLLDSSRYRDTDGYWENIPQYQATFGPPPLGAGPPTPGVPPQGVSYTIGPFNMFGPYKSGLNSNVGRNFYTSDAQLHPLLSPHRSIMSVPSLTLDYAFDTMNVKLVSSYNDMSVSTSPDFSYVDVASRSGSLEGGYNSLPNNGPYIPTLPLYSSIDPTTNRVRSLTEELRFSSNNPASPLSWVGGIFYNFTTLRANVFNTANVGDLIAASNFGAPSAAFIPSLAPLNGLALVAPQRTREVQIAAYGEATYSITEKLKATAGIRYTRDTFDFQSSIGGSLFGFPPGVIVQSAAGSVTESPITPKFGLQYLVDNNTNLYVTAAKGYRPGGVNGTLPPACQGDLANAGFPGGAPATYGSDSLWSYEGGAKLRTWGGRANINASVFRIDWKGVQTQINLACGPGFVTSAANAVSQGGELEGNFNLFPGFNLGVNVAYTDAHFTTSVQTAPGINLINAGDRMPYTPRWTGNVSAEYRFDVMGRQAYLRGDYSFSSAQVQTTGPGTTGYWPDAYNLPHSQLVNLRAGVTLDRLEIAAFVQNLFESRDLLSRPGIASGPGRVGCYTASCTLYAQYAQGATDVTYRPRTIGVTASYRY